MTDNTAADNCVLNRDLLPVIEQMADWRAEDVAVDFAARTVRNIVLSGGVSRNGHRYAAEALQSAAALYDRKPVFLDHAPNPAKPYERSMRDLVGTIAQARYEDGRIRGDIQVLDTEAGRTFLALVEGRTPAVGMSHVVLAQRGSDPQRVERIHDVISVDAVVFPATTSGFRESDAASPTSSYEALTEQLAAVTAERDRLLTEAEQRAKETAIDALLAATALPAEAVSEAFRDQLRALPDAEMRRQCVAERAAFVRRCRPRPLVSHIRQPATTNSDRTFVRTIRGERSSVLGGIS